MIPVSVRVRGFMSYREPQELHFDDDRLWVLEGPNGAGKSTIFDAITFALFGAHRLGKQHHDDLINHDSDRLEVEFVLRLEDETYKLLRCVPRKGRPIWQISRRAAKDGCFVPVSGTEQQDTYTAWVREHLGLDYEAFTTSVLLLQGESEKLIREKPAKRHELLAQLIDLSRYARLHERAKKHADKHEAEAKRLERQLGGLRDVRAEDVSQAEAALSLAEQERGAFDRALEELRTLLPMAEQRERLLAEQERLSGSRAAQQALLAQAAEIRERAQELAILEPVLRPLREAAAARKALSEASREEAERGAPLDALRAAEEDALAEEQAAQQRQQALEPREEASRKCLVALGSEREGLLPLQAKWNAGEEMRRQQEHRAAEIAALPAAVDEAVERTLAAAKQALEDHRAEGSRLRAELKLLSRRLSELDRLTGSMGGEPVACSLCGQEVTAEHAREEKARVQREHERLQGSLAAAEQATHSAEKVASEAQDAHDTVLRQVQRRRILERDQEQTAKALTRQLRGLTPEAAQAAVQRLRALDPALAAATAEMTALQTALRDARTKTDTAVKRRQSAEVARGGLERALEGVRAKRQLSLGKLEVLLAQLPEELWEARPEQVAATEQRLSVLRRYGEMAARLREAETDEAGSRLATIAEMLDEIPEAARRPAAALRAELDQKRDARKTVQEVRDLRAAELGQVKADLHQRAELEKALRAAKHEQRVYGLLADLLGPEELQRRLVRDAEQAIVQFANQELTGLTQGRLRLSLRPGKDGEDAAQKALDLLVSNQETGEQPTALALASGSQKFRIAISLALAIGRYLARETKRVESVIIDEGFGCLDRSSREDAIAVLRELSGHLSRVILVSHQEEFSGRFSSGYRIELVDRSSVPKRVSR